MYVDNPGANPQIAKQKEIEMMETEKSWEELLASLAVEVGEETARETVRAFREHYALFGDGLVSWFANLYDHETGGYYYSNSARETAMFRPDLESTYQSLQFMLGSGMCRGLSESECVPEWMSERIVRFTKSLQDPNGYFYHPQWGKKVIDKMTSRRGRDLTWGDRLLKRFNSHPTYDTPSGNKGDGILADGSLAPLCISCDADRTAQEKKSDTAVPEHLSSKESFIKYLEGLDIAGDGYYVGNLLESQSDQIVARDKTLAAEGADYRLSALLKEHFTKFQNPKTGLFTPYDKVDYLGINGLLKIISAFHRTGNEFPLAVNAFRSAMELLTSDIAPTTVCFVLNPWYAMTYIIDNIEEFGSDGDGGTEKAVSALRREMLERAPELIRATSKKCRLFLKEDGSISYMPHICGPNSQGLPVAIYGTNEGDVNASYIISVALTSHLFNIFGYKMVPLFTPADRERYLEIIKRNILNGAKDR